MLRRPTVATGPEVILDRHDPDVSETPVSAPLRAFFFYADTPRRREALGTPPGSAERYALYGLDQLPERGVEAGHNLERVGPLPVWARVADRAAAELLRRTGGTGGDMGAALASVGRANAADVVVATIDRLGIPLTLLARARVLRAPLVYVSVGLPERLDRLRGRVRSFHLAALERADAFVAYARREADVIRESVAAQAGIPVTFVPFGVDTAFFAGDDRAPDVDVVSVGADPHRDYPVLLQVASRRPDWRFLLVVARELERGLGALPTNVTVEVDVPLADVRDRLRRARVVALPVRDNSYSGATTTLLQAMACARPVVVSRTAAIAEGYGLADRENVRFVAPGDEHALESALAELLADRRAAAELGLRARRHVERELTWERYVDAMLAVLRSAAARHSRR